MKKLLILIIFVGFLLPASVLAEDKPVNSGPAGAVIPKLQKTANDPELMNGHVYPNWGPVCQRYTYSVVYRDKEGRSPEYVQIYFNGKMIDMDPTSPKASLGKKDFQQGVRYEYKFVPNKLGSNFYYFEASNGLGKTRDSIIDSPDNGPVLFKSAFDKNEASVIDVLSGKKILKYNAGKDWVGGVALSDDGRYLAIKTSSKILLFDTSKPQKSLWEFDTGIEGMQGDVKGGVDISADGSRIFASIGTWAILFNSKSNKPVWKYEVGQSAYNAAISANGEYMAVGTAGDESDENSNLLVLWNQKSQKPLWQYHSSGNFHDISLSRDGSFITGATGCPDRRAYIFSKDSNNPIVRTEMLTRDSPVHRAKISADGSLAAFGSESDMGAIFLFSKSSSNPTWKFSIPGGSSVRALNFTPDGKYIGAATLAGQVYIFSKDLAKPLVSWEVRGALGAIDISDDGSFIAVGGTDKRLYLFEKESKKERFDVSFDEYIQEIDISGNGKYIAAGTGGSVYFFESFAENESKTFSCSQVIEPPQESGMDKNQPFITRLFTKIINFFKHLFGFASDDENGKQVENPGVCGNNLCEQDLGETKESCQRDCSTGD